LILIYGLSSVSWEKIENEMKGKGMEGKGREGKERKVGKVVKGFFPRARAGHTLLTARQDVHGC
jgi:hypothetical protein